MMDSIVLEEPSSSIAYGGGGRAIDRHNPLIRDEKRLRQGRIFPSRSTTTTVEHNHQNLKPEVHEVDDHKRKSISPASSSRCLLSDKATFNFSSEFHHFPLPSPPPPPSPPLEPLKFQNSQSFMKKYDDLFYSPPPPPSTPSYEALTFLNLDDDSPSSSPPKTPMSPPLPPHESLQFHNRKACNEKHHDPPSNAALTPQPPPPSSDQVVVLEVSLHCRGCERKMKKHISKIEGVTSFKIEFAAKKVTVVGDVTPLAVLTSVLKVKNAKLLTSATISSSSDPTGSVPTQSSRLTSLG